MVADRNLDRAELGGVPKDAPDRDDGGARCEEEGGEDPLAIDDSDPYGVGTDEDAEGIGECDRDARVALDRELGAGVGLLETSNDEPLVPGREDRGLGGAPLSCE